MGSSSLTRDGIQVPALGARSLSHWTTRGVPSSLLLLLLIFFCHYHAAYGILGFPSGSDGKESACSAGDMGSIPGLGGPPGVGNGELLQFSCLEESMDRGAWWAAVHRATKTER